MIRVGGQKGYRIGERGRERRLEEERGRERMGEWERKRYRES